MNTDSNRFYRSGSVFIFVSLLFLTSCTPTTTSTPFRPPTSSAPTEILTTTTPAPQLFTSTPETPTLAVSPTPTATLPCTNDLAFVQDLTIPDGTIVTPASSVDKQWQVTNSGTCNWDSTYRLKWIGGDSLGATTEQALYPARAGSEATLQIVFTAPSAAGTYSSTWQAFDPDGVAFGDTIYMEIVISP